MSQSEESEVDYDSVSDDDEIVQTDVNLFPPTQPVHQNQVLELVRHNNYLQTLLRKSSLELQNDHNRVANFYCRLKDSCKRLKKAYEDSQRTITNLKVDKWNLTRELSERNMERLSITPGNEETKPQEGNYQADFEDTVNSLKKQLEKCEREKQQAMQTYGAKLKEWEQYNAQLQNTWNAREAEWHNYILQLKEEQENTNYQAQVDHHKLKTELEETIETLRKQTTMLLKDAEEQKGLLESKEESIKVLQSRSQENEMRILDLSKSLEAKDKLLREKNEHFESLQDKLGKAEDARKEKEKSLDQMVGLCNELQLAKGGLTLELKDNRVKLDQIYAQYLCAEESLKKKSEEAAELNRKLQNCDPDSSVIIFKQQALIFENDFKMEREARQELHREYDKKRLECDRLTNIIGQYQTEREQMIRDMKRFSGKAAEWGRDASAVIYCGISKSDFSLYNT